MTNLAPERKQLKGNNEYWDIFLQNTTVSNGSIVQYRSSTFRVLNAIDKPLEQITPNDIDNVIDNADTKINKLYVKSFFTVIYSNTDLKESLTKEMLIYLLPENYQGLIK